MYDIQRSDAEEARSTVLLSKNSCRYFCGIALQL